MKKSLIAAFALLAATASYAGPVSIGPLQASVSVLIAPPSVPLALPPGASSSAGAATTNTGGDLNGTRSGGSGQQSGDKNGK